MPTRKKRTHKELVAEIEQLNLRLEEAEETLHAIRNGEVDALVVGDRVYTLEGAEHPYRVLVESMNEGAATLETDGTICYCNSRLATMLHVPMKKLIGTALKSYVDQSQWSLFERILERCTKEQSATELLLINGRGAAVPVHFSCRALGQDHAGMGAVITDLSETKRKDEIIACTSADLDNTLNELHEKEHMLLMQSRMAAMGEMISNIAHQWRQPLNSLALSIQQLGVFYDSGHLDREVLQKSTETSMKLIRHMSDTIDDFRNFFKSDKECTEFNVRDAIHKTLSLLEGVLKSHNIETVTDLNEDILIYGRENEYSQAILNIVTNAKDAIDERKPEHPRLYISAFNEAGSCVVTVRDNAGGIPDDIIGKIFDPHFSTKGPQGTGIGLFMAKTIVERNMNGRLSVRNIRGGAEFRIKI